MVACQALEVGVGLLAGALRCDATGSANTFDFGAVDALRFAGL